MRLKIFFCQFLNPWVLRVSGMGGYTSKCEKKSKSLHPIIYRLLLGLSCKKNLHGNQHHCHTAIFFVLLPTEKTQWPWPPGGYKEMSSIFAGQQRPRIRVQMRGEEGSCRGISSSCSLFNSIPHFTPNLIHTCSSSCFHPCIFPCLVLPLQNASLTGSNEQRPFSLFTGDQREYRIRIHERTITLRFLGIIMRVLRLEVSVCIS